MIKEDNKRIIITLSKKQIGWIEKQCKKLHLTQSRFISWLISRKAQELYEYFIFMKGNLSEDEIEQIVKAEWIK